MEKAKHKPNGIDRYREQFFVFQRCFSGQLPLTLQGYISSFYVVNTSEFLVVFFNFPVHINHISVVYVFDS